MERPALSSTRSPSGTRGFTATDLLVTLAVIAVLAAIVVPMAARARAKSRLELCLSNMKQVTRDVQE